MLSQLKVNLLKYLPVFPYTKYNCILYHYRGHIFIVYKINLFHTNIQIDRMKVTLIIRAINKSTNASTNLTTLVIMLK